jgi:hypothetical protein
MAVMRPGEVRLCNRRQGSTFRPGISGVWREDRRDTLVGYAWWVGNIADIFFNPWSYSGGRDEKGEEL